ncbi:MAG: beta-ketoacyl-ACP synthase II [Candidatus Sumerlaeota bacterium]|nr:beta-ketoacyl-ACP synthase II [Candidatus Sumerlaeota bacterium]
MSANNSRRRVAITGMGAVTPLGVGVEAYWQGLVEGRTNVVRMDPYFDTSDLPCQIAAYCSAYNADDHFDKKDQKRNARFAQFAVVAAREAVKNAGLDLAREDPWRVGALLGCGIGGMDFIEEQVSVLIHKGARRVSPLLIPKIIANMASGAVAIDLGIKGLNASIASACASAAHALGESVRVIQSGDADVMISGGSEAALCRIALAGFGNMNAVTSRNDDPLHASRPFDAQRDGFVMGEGAGVLILEAFERAKGRGATILAELAGYGATDDAFHITAPDSDGAGGAKAMALALEDAGLSPEDIQYVNAHGTSTPINDRTETLAIKAVFGEHARRLAISSNKSMIGHLLGAAAAVEAIATILTIREGVIPPTINYEYPDPDCDLDYVPNVARRSRVDAAISNSLGFGGHNGMLLFRKAE